ncbi:MAG: RsmB/NOP family class I SAM-dependent RNA methyltransferase [Acutalibacteraceae bacterium]
MSQGNLPGKFLLNMKNLLNDEFGIFLSEYEKPHYRGIRINTLKASCKDVKKLLEFETTPSPFCDDGLYIPPDTEGLGRLPLHHAGAFYVQEPSATSAVTVLDVKKGDIVLDLCAAPGGKSTQIASALNGTGLLWSNEIVKSRANILLSNIERAGVRNCVVSSCRPDELCERLSGFFDKILVDAPCSGEGMFRKDKTAIDEWSEEHTRTCAVRQLAILESAAKALKPGGTLVYSTCTFSKEENEGVILKFLDNHKEFMLEDFGADFGRRTLDKAVRIFPMDGGEGHFAAKLKKSDGIERFTPYDDYKNIFTNRNKDLKNSALKLYDDIFTDRIYGEKFAIAGDKLILLPENLPSLLGLHILRAGILFGEIKKNRIEPCHALFMAGSKDCFNSLVDLDSRNEDIFKYLRGEEISVPDSTKGYTAVCVNGIVTGFGKASNGVLKNKYPKGLRNF